MLKAKFLGYKIEELRKRRGLTLLGLAECVDPEAIKSVAVSISGYEKGENVPNGVTLFLISRVLETSMESFFEVEDERDKPDSGKVCSS